jgi:deoxyribodipyrimidine photo-lyase
MICPPTRAAALAQLGAFLPSAGLYARDRNQVNPGHAGVTRLSPAIRHRLITEEEAAHQFLATLPFSRVEKLIQEIYWRRYWKSWLALRPAVWDHYVSDLEKSADSPAVRQIEAANSGNAVIDHFSQELIDTGYLHNHARMWFAAWWIHEARLPWQAGAAFFFRHLLDGDPASNTLSWRWVAGLQTPGKTYLARRSNLEKYLDPSLLSSLAEGLAAFENPRALTPAPFAKPPITHRDWPSPDPTPPPATGLWIHEEDLSVETSPLGQQAFPEIIVTATPPLGSVSNSPLGRPIGSAAPCKMPPPAPKRTGNRPSRLKHRPPTPRHLSSGPARKTSVTSPPCAQKSAR